MMRDYYDACSMILSDDRAPVFRARATYEKIISSKRRRTPLGRITLSVYIWVEGGERLYCSLHFSLNVRSPGRL